MNRYAVTIPVTASNPDAAKRAVLDALGADEHSINDIGGLTVEFVPDEKQYIVCRGCGEACDSIITAQQHGTFIPGPDPSWCGENGFDIVHESEAF